MKRNHPLLLLLLTALLLPLAVRALPPAPLTDAQIRQQISQAATALKSMQCDFEQTKQLRLLGDKLVSRGKMYYQQSDKLRWEYQSPYTYTFVLSGQKVMLRNSRKTDVVDVQQNKLFREIACIMMNSVVGKSLADERDFKTTLRATSTEFVATLQPQRKDMRRLFRQIVLHFSRRQQVVSSVELFENNGDQTLIELKNIKTNAPLAPALFAVD